MGRVALSTRRIGIVLCLVGFFWGLTLLNLSLNKEERTDSETIRAEIIGLSEAYVTALAREQADVVDGPRVGVDTGYELKKAMAVLLESILHRVQKLENQMTVFNNATPPDPAVNRSSSADDHLKSEAKKTLIDLISEKVSCELTDMDRKRWPNCANKMAWMRNMWNSDSCYLEYGVDGTECSFRLYLAYVERFCPPMAGLVVSPVDTPMGPSKTLKLVAGNKRPILVGPLPINHRPPKSASLNTDLETLLLALKERDKRRQTYDWIKLRLRRTWPLWVNAGERLASNASYFSRRHRKNVVIFMGLLSQRDWRFGEMAFRGGPLGELVQWSDVIAALYLLGHKVVIAAKVDALVAILRKDPHSKRQGCPPKLPSNIDLIFTDITGLRQLKQHLKEAHKRYSCRLRVLDSFGTEAPFNSHAWVAKSRAHIKRYDTVWGKHDLDLKQFYTMFPHTPDNTFLGFVSESPNNSSFNEELESERRQNISLVYGKDPRMWIGKESLLKLIHDTGLEVHGTVFADEGTATAPPLPEFVVNHGLLSAEKFQKLLRRSKLFVGLGFPYEGPAALEAIANGAIFLNPKFSPPHGRSNTEFFKGKPTNRHLTSQHPYAEQFVKEPLVMTVDVDDEKALKAALEKVKRSTVSPHLPFEFTALGMLQRIALLVENQNFCDVVDSSVVDAPTILPWPPQSSMTIGFAAEQQNCKDYCHSAGLICESSYLPLINEQMAFVGAGLHCATMRLDDGLHFPAFNAAVGVCVLQRDPLLFSCSATPIRGEQRLCPCRDYLPEQTAVCRNCLYSQPWD